MRELKQFFTYTEPQTNSFVPISTSFNQLANLNHLQMQVDHLAGTHFVQATMIIDTTSIGADLRAYLELFASLLFELPIKCDAEKLDWCHEQVVYELNKDLLEFDVSIGLNGSQFDPGSFSQYLAIYVKVQINMEGERI